MKGRVETRSYRVKMKLVARLLIHQEVELMIAVIRQWKISRQELQLRTLASMAREELRHPVQSQA